MVEQGETCDGGAVDCTTLPGGFTGGSATCRPDCSGYDTSACTTGGTVPVTVQESGTVARYEWHHYGPYEAQPGQFRAVMTGTGDADLYVRKAAQPTTSSYHCRPYLTGSSETCTLDLTVATLVYVSVRGYATTSTYELETTYPSLEQGGVEWPNADSSANSDAWIAQHHGEITVMRPRVLALNFVNAKSMEQMTTQLQSMANVIAEASRFHGYSDASAPAFLQYELAYAVDLRDAPVPSGWAYNNSTRYPREEPVEGYWGFDYERLFTQEYADYFGIEDPQVPGQYLTLAELVDRGLVHEVWVFADGDVPDANMAEVLEVKPYYDADRIRRDVPLDRCAGNGCFDAEDDIPLTRSLRIAAFNHNRGLGCFLESLSHGMESVGSGSRNVIPYLAAYFDQFANRDLDERYGLPFDSWYACPYNQSCLSYPSQTSVTYNTGSASGTIASYDPVCGNVHIIPNGQSHYDLASPATVMSSCAHFRDGSGATEPFSAASFAAYQSMAGDCMGPFLVWWRQNMPGLGNSARDAQGGPMLNWWPFLFY